MLLYEEVTLMKPFRRKTLVIIGTGGVGRQVDHSLPLSVIFPNSKEAQICII